MSIRHTLYGSFRVIHAKLYDGRWPAKTAYRVETYGYQEHLDVSTIAQVCKRRSKCTVHIVDDRYPYHVLATETWYPEGKQ